MKFSELDLNDQLLEALSYIGFESATEIQEKAIPTILEGKDLIACAQTGTGKTAAFILPILNFLSGRKNHDTVDSLIIVPTRELAIQIESDIQGLAYFVDVSSIAIYGGGDGADFEKEKRALMTGADIVVATPGRLLAHLQMGYVNFKNIKHLVLDEADRMLNMGFIDDINRILEHLSKDHQSLMFSATMPKAIRDLAKKTMKDPLEISLAISKPAEGVDQKVYLTHDDQKIPMLRQILKERPNYDSVIIFSTTKAKVGDIVHGLKKGGFPAQGISSNLEQKEREEVLREFKSKRLKYLVATDVMSRGIDVKEINLVVNFDAPTDAEDYVHRVGRTARANTKGEAITLINPKDMYSFKRIEDLIEMEIPKLNVPEEIGKSPEWKIERSSGKGRGRKGGRHQSGGKNFRNKGHGQKKRRSNGPHGGNQQKN